jgi:type IV pilus assembly protein PilC
MGVYSYKAMDKMGSEINGTIDAETVALAVAQVRDLGYFPTRVVETKAAPGTAVRTEEKTSGGLQMQIKIPFLSGRVSVKQLAIFTRQLATLIDAGLPLVRSLNTLGNQQKPGTLKDIITSIGEDVEGGNTFSEALAKFPKVFSKLYISMIRAGEVGGVMETVLTRLAEFSEQEQSLRRKIKSAMIYPAFVTFAGGGIVIFLVTFIIPTFAEMFSDLGANLPKLTLMLIKLSDLFKHRWYVLIGAVIFLILLLKLLNSKPKSRYLMDKIKLGIPIFGSLIIKVIISRFSRTLGTLIASGVPILQALNITRDVVGNDVVARAVQNVHDSIREGENIGPALESSRVFPLMVTSMIEVGEETGSLDSMLNKIADNYEEEVDTAVAGMMSVMEPVMIIFMGGAVGVIVIALFLPLIELGLIAGG